MDFLDDVAWDSIRHLFVVQPHNGGGRPPTDPRTVLAAILWVQGHGGRWVHLPRCFPAQQTCYPRYLVWKKDGRLQQALDILAGHLQSKPEHVFHPELALFSGAATALS